MTSSNNRAQLPRARSMAIVAFWLALIFFVGCLAIVWWILLVDHGDLTEEPYEGEQDNPLAGADGVRNNSSARGLSEPHC